VETLIANLPALNASLIALCLVLILRGWLAIRKKNIIAHKRAMISAFVTLLVFLVFYLGRIIAAGVTPYSGSVLGRQLYLIFLTSHITAALVCLPLVIFVLRKGLRNEIEPHRRWAKIALPLWIYVCVTGLMIYFILY
jgi:putative membrane protein